MDESNKKKPVRRSRRFLRWTRYTFWAVLMVVASVLLYLSLIGVPEFVKDQLQTELHTRGVQLQLGRVRLRGIRTFLIEDVELGRTALTNGPHLLIDRAELRLDGQALSRFALQPEGLKVQRGRVVWPLLAANSGTSTDPNTNQFTIENITTQLRFPTVGDWHLEELRGKLRNADIEISGRITNAGALRRPRPDRSAEDRIDWVQRMAPVIEQLQRIQFSEPAVLSIYLEGDGRNSNRFRANISCQISSAQTPWGKLEKLKLAAIVSPESADHLNGQLRLSCVRAEGKFGELNQLQLTGRLKWSFSNSDLESADCQMVAANAHTPWADADSLHVSAESVRDGTVAHATHRARIAVDSEQARIEKARLSGLTVTALINHSIESWQPLQGEFSAAAREVSSELGRSREAQISGKFNNRSFTAIDAASPSEEVQSIADAKGKTREWGPWRFLAPFVFDTECQIIGIDSPKIRIDRLAVNSRWNAPGLTIDKLRAELYGGHFNAAAQLNVDTRELHSQAQFNFDAHQISPLLTTNAQRWLRQFTWETPPEVQAEAKLILPAWTNQLPNWRKEVLPTVQLAGEFEGRSGAFRKVSVTGARSHFSMTNQFWRLPDLTVIRPEGTALLDYRWWMGTQDYYWKIQSGIDIKALRPVLDPPEQKVLDDFEFTVPPFIEAEIWGRWHDRTRIGFQGNVATTNFVFRGEQCTSLASSVQFTNLFFRFRDITVRSGSQLVKAPAAGFDPVAHFVYVTNAVSSFDPDRVTRIIGPKSRAALKPYRFHDPPTAVVNGRLPTHPKAEADVRFQISGKTFEYWKFRVPEASADVHWRGDWLSISNLNASFYNGRLNWQGEFDFSAPHKGADFKFNGRVTRADLSTLAANLTGTTNHLDGLLTGSFAITSANSELPASWTGYGNFRLRDGFLWNIPVFGVFSPILDKVTGLGSSKITSGSAGFKIDRGLIRTDNLELRSSAVRLQYAGTVDLEGNVNARVQAEILRDAWAVGRIVSLALWPVTKIFEYKITGTMNAPESEPLYVPKFILWPLQPFRAMKQIFDASEESALIPSGPAPAATDQKAGK